MSAHFLFRTCSVAAALVAALVLPIGARPAAAQANERPFEAAIHFASADPRQFEEIDLGIGGRFSWRAVPLLGIDAEITAYPGNYPDDFAFSEARWEGYFGPTVGPRVGRVRPFAKLRPGFLVYQEAPEPLVCIAIFPPPLACALSEGRTQFALDIGGGIDIGLTERTLLRIDAGDRLVRYDFAVRDRENEPHPDGFWAHGFRLTVGAGVRF